MTRSRKEKRKKKEGRERPKEKPPERGSYLPPGHRRLKQEFIRLLGDWGLVHMPISDPVSGVMHQFVYFVSPDRKVYRNAFAAEEPTLVIDSPLLPNEHTINLVRVASRRTRVAVKKRLRHVKKLSGG